MICCKCKREAKMQINGYEWMCAHHGRALIRQFRIKRKLEKLRKKK